MVSMLHKIFNTVYGTNNHMAMTHRYKFLEIESVVSKIINVLMLTHIYLTY